MSKPIRILGLAGSLRRESYNRVSLCGADRLRSILKLLNDDFSDADKVGTLHDMRFLFLDNDEKNVVFLDKG